MSEEKLSKKERRKLREETERLRRAITTLCDEEFRLCYRFGDYEDAMALFTSAFQLDVTHSHRIIANCKREMLRYSEAVDDYRAQLRYYDKHSEYPTAYEEGENFSQFQLETRVTVASMIFELQRCYTSMGSNQVAEAEEALERLLRLPDLITSFSALADRYYREQDFNLCSAALTRALQAVVAAPEPDLYRKQEVLCQLADATRLAGDFPQAARYAQEVLASCEEANSEVWQKASLTVVATTQGSDGAPLVEAEEDVLAEAMFTVNQILHVRENNEAFINTAAHLWRGHLFLAQGALPSACVNFEMCAQAEEPAYGSFAGLDMRGLRKHVAAIDQAGQRIPGFKHTCRARHFTKANLQVLVELYSELLLRFGPDPRVFWYRANCRKILGELYLYAMDLDNMHKHDPDFFLDLLRNPPPDDFHDRTLVAWLQWRLIDLIGAVQETLRHELDQQSTRVATSLTMLKAYYTLTNDVNRAVSVVQERSTSNFAHNRACYADLLRQEGDLEGAWKGFEEALSMDPNCPVALQGRLFCRIYRFEFQQVQQDCVTTVKLLLNKASLYEKEINLVEEPNAEHLDTPEITTLLSTTESWVPPKAKKFTGQKIILPTDFTLDSTHFKKWITRRQLAIVLAAAALSYEMVGHVNAAALLVGRALALDVDCFVGHYHNFLHHFRSSAAGTTLDNLYLAGDSSPLFMVGINPSQLHCVRMPKPTDSPWGPLEPEDYYTPNLLGCSDPYFKKAELVHPLYHQEQEEKRAQEEKERRLGLRPRTEDTDDGDSKKKKKKKPLLGEEYRPPPEAQHWGALDWYLECSQLLAQRSTDGFVTAWEYLVKRDEEYIPEPNLLISLFEKKEEVWREHKRTRKGMLAVMVAGKVDRVVLDLLCRGRWFEEQGLHELACADYSYGLHFTQGPELWWQRCSLARLRGNSRFALQNVSHALALTREQATAVAAMEKAGKEQPPLKSNVLKERIIRYQLLRAHFSFQLEDWEACVKDTTEVLKVQKRHTFAYRQRSLAYAHMQDYEAALEDLEAYCSLVPKDAANMLRMAHMNSVLNRHEKAHALLTKLDHAAPGSPNILYTWALAFYREHKWVDAHQVLIRCLKLDPNYWDAFLRLAEVQERLGKLDQAMDTCHHVLERMPRYPGVHRTLGRLHLGVAQHISKRLQEEEERAALAKKVKEAEASDSRLPPNAKSSFGASASKSMMSSETPKVAKVKTGVVEATDKSLLGQASALLKIMKQANHEDIQNTPEYVSIFIRKALAELRQAILVDEHDGEALFLMAYSLIFLAGNAHTDHETPMQQLDRALLFETRFLPSAFLKGFLLLREGASKHDEALKLFNKVLRESSGSGSGSSDILALKARSYVYFVRGKKGYPNAKQGYNRLIQKANVMDDLPLRGVSYGHRGLVKMMEGDYREALVDFEQALSIDPHNALALMYRAECNEKLRDKEDAIEDYHTSIAMLSSEFRQVKQDHMALLKDQERRRLLQERQAELERQEDELQQQRKALEAPSSDSRSRNGSRRGSFAGQGTRETKNKWKMMKKSTVITAAPNLGTRSASPSEPVAQSLSHFRLLAMSEQDTQICGTSGIGDADLNNLNNALGILLHEKNNKKKSRLFRRANADSQGMSLKDREERADKFKAGLIETIGGNNGGKSENALDAFTNNNGETEPNHYNTGLVFLEQNNLKRALDSFEKAVKANAQLANSHNNYGVVLELVSQLAEAENEYLAATSKSPHLIASFNLANIRNAKQSFPDAIERYTAVIAMHTDALESVREEREQREVQRELQQASNDRLAEEDNEADEELNYREELSKRLLPLAYNNRAICHHNLHHYDEALRGYNKALELNPNIVYTKMNRAHLLMSIGDCYAALQDLRDVQRHRSSEYLTNLYDFCKRYQWGLAVACKDLVAGVHTLPFVNSLNLRAPVNPPGMFDPFKLPGSSSTDLARLETLLAAFQGFGARSHRFLEEMGEALAGQLKGDLPRAFQALVKATYLQPKHEDDSITLDMREVIVLWRAIIMQRMQGNEAAIRDLQLHLGSRLNPISERKREAKARATLWGQAGRASELEKHDTVLEDDDDDEKDLVAEIDKRDSVLLNYLGCLYHYARKHVQGYGMYEAAIELNRNNISALLNRGNLARAQGRFHTTIADYTHVMEVIMNDGEMTSSEAQREVYRVLKEYVLVLKQSPHEAWHNIGPLQGSLAIAVDRTEMEHDPHAHRSQAAQISLEGLNNVCDAYISHLLDTTKPPDKAGAKRLISLRERLQGINEANKMGAGVADDPDGDNEESAKLEAHFKMTFTKMKAAFRDNHV